eukprot:3942008-Rhodomonas_salina.4
MVNLDLVAAEPISVPDTRFEAVDELIRIGSTAYPYRYPYRANSVSVWRAREHMQRGARDHRGGAVGAVDEHIRQLCRYNGGRPQPWKRATRDLRTARA